MKGQISNGIHTLSDQVVGDNLDLLTFQNNVTTIFINYADSCYVNVWLRIIRSNSVSKTNIFAFYKKLRDYR